MIGKLPDTAFLILAKRFLAYSFLQVPYHENLTPQERNFCTKEEFDALREWALGERGREESPEVYATCPQCGPDTVSTNVHTWPEGICNLCRRWVNLEDLTFISAPDGDPPL